MTFQLPSDSAS
jgi:ATP-binding cassette, subfamily A (ABC1), member 3